MANSVARPCCSNVVRFEVGVGHAGLRHNLVGILGGRLPSRTVARDIRRHGVFVVVTATLADLGSKLVEVPPLDGLQLGELETASTISQAGMTEAPGG